MNNPVEKKRIAKRLMPLDPCNPEIYASETNTQLNGEVIEEIQQDDLRYLPNGVQIQKDTVLFRDPVSGEIVDMASTYLCSGCYQRYSLKGLKKDLPDEKKQFCGPCWRKEKWTRRKKALIEWFKKIMEPV